MNACCGHWAPLKATRAIRSNCAVLRRLIGELPLKALEGKEPVDIISGRIQATRSRLETGCFLAFGT